MSDGHRRAEALRAADEYFGHIEQSPEFAGAADVALKTDRNPLLRLAFADGYLHALRVNDAAPQAMEKQAFERVTALRLALRDLLDAIGDEPCRFDHHGYCQEHFISSPCEVATARHILENA